MKDRALKAQLYLVAAGELMKVAKQGDWELYAAAARAYRRAYNTVPDPNFLLKEAQAHAKAYQSMPPPPQEKDLEDEAERGRQDRIAKIQGQLRSERFHHLREAVEQYYRYTSKRFSRLSPDELSEEEVSKLSKEDQQTARNLQKEFGPLVKELERVKEIRETPREFKEPSELVILTKPRDAKVHYMVGDTDYGFGLDEEVAADTSPSTSPHLWRFEDPTTIYLQVSREGYESWKGRVDIYDLSVIKVTLSPKPPKVWLETSRVGATVYVDQNVFGTTPFGSRPLEVGFGEHEITVAAQGYRPWRGLIILEPGNDDEGLFIDLEPSVRRRVSEGLFQGGLLGIGIGTTLLYAASRSDEGQVQADRAGWQRGAGWVSLGLANAAALIAGWLWLTDESHLDTETLFPLQMLRGPSRDK